MFGNNNIPCGLTPALQTKFQEVILEVSPDNETLPIGITVMAELAQ